MMILLPPLRPAPPPPLPLLISSPPPSETGPPSTSQVSRPRTHHDPLALAICVIGMSHHISNLESLKF